MTASNSPAADASALLELQSVQSQPLPAFWQPMVRQVDLAIEEAIERFCQTAPLRLSAAIRYSWLAPGKRLRPILVLLAAEAVGGASEWAMPAAVAVEAIHCYSLIHDDLPAMDDDDLRRGRPTLHVQFDEATAILAGDALQPLAFACLAAAQRPVAQIAEAVQCLAAAAGPTALVGGQMLDIEAETSGGDLRTLEAIHRGKTAAMIRVSCELGAIFGSGNEQHRRALTLYGEQIGLAFQIVDDLLDVRSDQAAMGKRTGKDAAAGKLTYPGLMGIQAAERTAGECIAAAAAALKPLGTAAERLIELAEYVSSRKS